MDETRNFNRREHERFALSAMYTTVEAMRNAREASEPLTGHAYDISEGGARIELDEPLAEGEPVHLRLSLPGAERTIRANANVVRVLSEDDDPGPRRMGCGELLASSDGGVSWESRGTTSFVPTVLGPLTLVRSGRKA